MEKQNHVVDLKRFFNKKRALVQKTTKFKYVVENEKFIVINKDNNQQEVSVKRLPKINIEEEIKKKNIDIHEIGNTLLSSKYGFLFGFTNMNEYEKELHNMIEPNEVKYETLSKEMEDLRVLKNKHIVIRSQEMEKLKLQKNVLIESLKLKEFDQVDFEISKESVMRDYIYKQKEMLDLLMNSPKENIEISTI